MAQSATFPTYPLAMSRLQAPENVSGREHEREPLVSSLDNEASVQTVLSIPAVERESEPIVTRNELWSYYSTSVRDLPCSCEEIERLQCTTTATVARGPW